MTTAATPEVTEITNDTFEFMGETIELDPKVGYELAAQYREAAIALHQAKDRAFTIEQQIKAVMKGYEHATVNGERVFSWIWKLKTTFNKKGLRIKYPEIHDEFVVKVENGTRSFSAPGVTGVE